MFDARRERERERERRRIIWGRRNTVTIKGYQYL